MTKMITPNISQQVALERLHRHRQTEGANKCLVVLPSGSGKTYLAAFDTKNVGAKSVLFLVHRNEILEQAVETFKNVHNLNNEQIGLVVREKKEFDRQFTFSTIQTISKPNNLYELSQRHFNYTIIDEYHHVSAKTYQMILDNLDTSFLLGLTATPYRFDNKDIMPYVDGNLVFEMDLKQGIEKKVLVPFIYNAFYDNVNYNDIEWNGYRYHEYDLNKKLLIESRDKQILEEFKELVGDNKQTVGFCVSVRHVERMVVFFNANGISAAGVTDKTSWKQRAEIIEDFRNRKYQVLFCRDIFNEGVDFPFVEALLFLRPTFSKVIFLQQLGRGLRLAKGKEGVMVLDFIGNYHNAYKIKHWLGIVNVSKEPIKFEDKRNKPEYDYSVPNVYFDSRIIDIFDEQEWNARRSYRTLPTKEELTENYYDVERKLGKPPTVEDVDRSDISKYPITHYKTVFGSWNKFLITIGVEPNLRHGPSKPTRQELIDEYYRVKKVLGRRPTEKQVKLKGGLTKYSIRSYTIVFGSWNKFLEVIGEREIKPTKEQLIENYRTVEKGVGRTPTTVDFDRRRVLSKYSYFLYTEEFGSWKKFREEMGFVYDTPPTKEQLTEDYYEMKKRLGKKPSEEDFNRSNSRYAMYRYLKQFGSWTKFLESIGERMQRPQVTRERLIDNYHKVEEKVGRKPLTTDFRPISGLSEYTHEQYLVEFGSWDDFLKTIGVKPSRRYTPVRPSVQRLIDNYNEMYRKLGRIPVANDLKPDGPSKYSMSSYNKEFGSWGKFREAMGVVE